MREHQPTQDEIEMAINIAMRDEVVKVAKSGFPISSWEDGKVVRDPPEEVLAMHDPHALAHYEFAEKFPPSIQLLFDKRPEIFKHCDSDVNVLESIARAKRAIVFMSVEWSGPERKRRKAFFQAIGRLHTLARYRDVEAFTLDEDVAELQQRFHSKTYNGAHPLGAGSLFWLAENELVSSSVHGYEYAEEVLTKAFCIWPTS